MTLASVTQGHQMCRAGISKGDGHAGCRADRSSSPVASAASDTSKQDWGKCLLLDVCDGRCRTDRHPPAETFHAISLRCSLNFCKDTDLPPRGGKGCGPKCGTNAHAEVLPPCKDPDLGRGGGGVVNLGKDPDLKAPVALSRRSRGGCKYRL